jgi:hypothetical protein
MVRRAYCSDQLGEQNSIDWIALGATIRVVYQVVFGLVLFVLAPAFTPTAAEQRPPTRSPHGPLVIPCENCHTSTSWAPIRAVPEFNHDATRYPLRGMHEKVYCTECHIKPVFTDVGKNCSDCHADIHRRQFGANCAECHTVLGWHVSVQSIKQHFNRFPLLGAHAVVECQECHKNAAVGQYQGLSTVCSSCHLADFQKTATIGGSVPNHVASNAFSAPCESCHTFDTWLNAKFDHSATGFLLTNGHANVACALCHINNNYNLTIAPNDCGNSGCHLTTWQKTTNPVHPTAGPTFALANCTTCHTTVSWMTATFDHATTGFPLTNGHANVACALCHINNNYSLMIAPTDCGNSACHLTTWQKTINPVHSTAGAQFAATNCAVCHNTVSWTTATFNHSATGFPLTNAHANVACALCHINNNYSLMIAPTDCGNSGCHLTTWQQTNNPVHSTAGAQFAVTNCAVCHNTVSWTTAAFDHSATGFALTGTHMSPTPTPCALCHVSNNYTLNSTDCYGCHQQAFLSTTSIGGNVPNHVTAGFPTTASACATCHPITTWAAGVFDHNATGFPLSNGHANVACNLCHLNNNYSLRIAPTDCGNSGCHLNTNYGGGWQGTTAPPHSAAGPLFAVANCTNCHTTVSFTTATFDHGTTGFALTGMHISPTPTPCIACHTSNNYALNSTACYGCHVTAWQSTTTLGASVPNHITSGYPTTCESCHTTTSWLGAVFNHNTTRFPLTGAHIAVACNLCHLTSAPPPLDCYSCHIAQWQSTTTLGGSVPNHITAGYPTTCASCHTTTSWLGAVFDHNKTIFPLTGAHTTVACNLCHTSSTPPPTNCYSCHTAAWQSTATLGGAVPDHLAADAAVAGIVPTACATCHNTTSWLGATFTHAWWNVNHGNAGGVCSACHTNSSGPGANYTAFQCTQCHGGGNAANFHHPNVNGYVYNSIVCYSCHKP